MTMRGNHQQTSALANSMTLHMIEIILVHDFRMCKQVVNAYMYIIG